MEFALVRLHRVYRFEEGDNETQAKEGTGSPFVISIEDNC